MHEGVFPEGINAPAQYGVRGTLVHDGLAGYKGLDCRHSLCNAHPLRELVFVHEQCNEKVWDGWAQEMIELLVQDGTVWMSTAAGSVEITPQRLTAGG